MSKDLLLPYCLGATKPWTYILLCVAEPNSMTVPKGKEYNLMSLSQSLLKSNVSGVKDWTDSLFWILSVSHNLGIFSFTSWRHHDCGFPSLEFWNCQNILKSPIPLHVEYTLLLKTFSTKPSDFPSKRHLLPSLYSQDFFSLPFSYVPCFLNTLTSAL